MASIGNRAKAEKSVKGKKQVFNTEGTITVRLGATINKGNYESARVDIGITLPFDANSKTGQETAYKEAKEWTAKKIKEELQIMGSTS